MVSGIFRNGIINEYNKEIFDDVVNLVPVLWHNPLKEDFNNLRHKLNIDFLDIVDADARLKRFAPLIKRLFPETNVGIIESNLIEIPWEIRFI